MKRSAYLRPGSTVGDKWNSFTIEYHINSGTFGLVYRARSQKTGETVAIKVMAKDWLAQGGGALECAKLEFEVLRRAAEEGRSFMTQLMSSWADQHNIYFVMVCGLHSPKSVGAQPCFGSVFIPSVLET